MRLGLGHGLDVGYRPELFATGGTSYLLDTYTGAAAAYSLRQLRTGVTSVVRVRRSSDNAEADFTAAEVTNGTLTTWTGANDGFVVTWYDQSGNTGRDATQSTASKQPQIVSSGSLILQGLNPCLDFDGSDDFLDTGYVSPLKNVSILTVGRVNVLPSTTKVFLGICEVADNQILMPRYDNATTGYLCYNFSLKTGITETTDLYLYELYAGATNAQFYENSSAIGGSYTALAGTNTFNTYIGASPYLGGTAYGDCRHLELIFWDSDQSGNRTAIEAAINSHYSIY